MEVLPVLLFVLVGGLAGFLARLFSDQAHERLAIAAVALVAGTVGLMLTLGPASAIGYAVATLAAGIVFHRWQFQGIKPPARIHR